MFDKILIANRGEIACRVIATARRMGIATVAVYSDADRDARHVSLADEGVHIGPAPAAESYLRADVLLEACRQTGVQAVHPGYGFLSENARFAEQLMDSGIAFIGPGPGAIQAMGDKITSKSIAEKASVKTIPGSNEVIRDAEHAVEIAADIGYPVMLKASAGGGGKGMRVATNEQECRDGFERASGEAKTSFGDDRVFIEKFIVAPRHIEIQILVDTYGNAVYLGERECSMQRRHQKVIEEAPSKFIDDATRRAMGEQAVQLARAVDYVSAGTVEFVVDADRKFYFLEMNTRLQVEHPVTEQVTGLDLVEQMIRIANGEQLSFAQEDISVSGWSVEARIYAEDPARGFLPSVGRLTRYQTPESDDAVRIDTGVREGAEVSMFYDPMIAKVIGTGADRDEAADNLMSALDRICIEGLAHNTTFLHHLLGHESFRAGEFTTGFIDEMFPDGFKVDAPAPDMLARLVAIAAFANYGQCQRAATLSGRMPGASTTVAEDWVVVVERVEHPVKIRAVDGGCEVDLEQRLFAIRGEWHPGQLLAMLQVNGEALSLQVKRIGAGYQISQGGASIQARVVSPRAAELNRHMLFKEPPDLSRFVLSPMPGLLVSIAVSEGQTVKAGEEVAVVEAMKMENSLVATKDGCVVEVLAAVGDSLVVDQPILELE
ncbi:MAG: acetyl/propionyl-CoA carboxylase subunit alpha [Thiotrichales bacterium]|nr:acetyl/propionyl-CoA carboxylase subunit alpha [Thiotrichales bacterium]